MFAIDEKIEAGGREKMNEELIKLVQIQKPDVLFCFLFTEELKKETIDSITRKTSTKTFNWFADDHWRFEIFSKYWAPHFTLVSTTDSEALSKYHRAGIKNVIKTQWAANTFLYQPQNNAEFNAQQRGIYGITFVGKNYGNRGKYISFLKNSQLPAEGYGSGWEKGRVSQEQMLEFFSNSKINLNFTESPYLGFMNKLKFMSKLFLERQSFLGDWNFKFQIFRQRRIFTTNFKFFRQAIIGAQRKQIKGRTFEIPACGGFLLTGDADNLRDYYIDGKEIVIFENKNDLAEKCKYYLEHDAERQQIAEMGYQRTIKEHTYAHRFREIFKALNLSL